MGGGVGDPVHLVRFLLLGFMILAAIVGVVMTAATLVMVLT